MSSLTNPDDQVIESLETTGRGWVIELDGVIVAFAIGNALTGSIWALFVDPPHRGRAQPDAGAGSCIVQEVRVTSPMRRQVIWH